MTIKGPVCGVRVYLVTFDHFLLAINEGVRKLNMKQDIKLRAEWLAHLCTHTHEWDQTEGF